MTDSNYPVGFEGALAGFVDPTTGGFLGKVKTLPNGSESGAFHLRNVITAGLSPAQPVDLVIRGGDRERLTVRWGNSKLTPFDLVVSDFNRALISAISNSNQNSTNSNRIVFGDNPNRQSPVVMAFSFWQRWPGEDGSLKYLHTIIPKAEVIYRRGGLEYRGESNSTISINPLMVSRAVDGQSFGVGGMNMGFEEDLADHYYIETANPVHWMAWRKEDSDADGFDCDYLPLSSVVTLNGSSNHWVDDGTVTALTSISTSTGAAVTPAVAGAGDLTFLEYATAFVPA